MKKVQYVWPKRKNHVQTMILGESHVVLLGVFLCSLDQCMIRGKGGCSFSMTGS